MARTKHPDVNRIKHLYVNCRKSEAQIAKEISISQSSVGYYLRKLGCVRTPSEAGKLAGKEGRRTYRRKLSNPQLEEIKRLYTTQYYSGNEIGVKYNVSSWTIFANLRKLGCAIRSPSEGRYLAWKQGKFQLPSGKDHYNWKGGTTQRKDGYVLERAPDHPRAHNGQVLQHILIWERAHNRVLPNGMHVHHLNGIRDDNRIENLLAVPAKKHDRFTLLHAAQERIKELESQLGNLLDM